MLALHTSLVVQVAAVYLVVAGLLVGWKQMTAAIGRALRRRRQPRRPLRLPSAVELPRP